MSTSGTNFSSAAPAEAAPQANTLARQSWSKTMITLMRRELWEHRALWMTPLMVAGLLILLAIAVHIGPMSIGASAQEFFQSPGNRRGIFTLVMWGQAVPQYLVMLVVLSFYLLDCLYQERKDRSILFWKSLPVSDADTVISKLLVAIVLVPLLVYAVALVTSILTWALWSARQSFGALIPNAIVWNTIDWLKVQALMLYGLLVSMCWYAPLAAFLLLVSVWARKNVILWATLPPLILLIFEKPALGTTWFKHLLEYRTWGVFGAMGLDHPPPDMGHGRVVSLADLFDNVAMSKALTNIDLWLGLAVAAALVLAAIRIRRYRDDT